MLSIEHCHLQLYTVYPMQGNSKCPFKIYIIIHSCDGHLSSRSIHRPIELCASTIIRVLVYAKKSNKSQILYCFSDDYMKIKAEIWLGAIDIQYIWICDCLYTRVMCILLWFLVRFVYFFQILKKCASCNKDRSLLFFLLVQGNWSGLRPLL